MMGDGTYTNITAVKEGDFVMGYFSKSPHKVSELIKHTHTLKNIEETNRPYIIKKSACGDELPNKDIHLSGHHRVILVKDDRTFLGVQTFKLDFSSRDDFYEDKPEDSVVYYHIKLDNKTEGIIVNGMPVETCQD